jgi:V-type H+-transporting ATPase subunit F
MWLRRETQVAEKIRPTMDKYHQTFPTVLEIPSKDHPYGKSLSIPYTRGKFLLSFPLDPSKDSVLKRVQKLVGD